MTRAVLLSIEPWDDVWRRNQQLASRVPAALFVEPAAAGIRSALRAEAGVPVLRPAKPLPNRFGFGMWLSARVAARQVRRALGGNPKVTWATHPYHLDLALALAAPVLYDRTDDWPLMETDAVERERVAEYDRRLTALAATVVIVSEGMRLQTRADAVLVPNGVDLNAFTAVSPRPPSTSGRLRVGYAGTLDPVRFDYPLLQALAHRADIELMVAGPGEPPAGAASVGPIPHDQVPAFLSACDALVAPYRVDNPVNATSDALKLYEYFATGLPVIATATAGFQRHPDLVIRPDSDDLIGDVAAHAASAPERRRIAATATWSSRANVMRRLLITVAGG